jgi:hypothetical protein
MGMFREASSQEIDIVKEMAKSLGGAGWKLEEILEKTNAALARLQRLFDVDESESSEGSSRFLDLINESIREYNRLVDLAENALNRLLIQREACGFRTHRYVSHYYPIPSKIKLLRR